MTDLVFPVLITDLGIKIAGSNITGQTCKLLKRCKQSTRKERGCRAHGGQHTEPDYGKRTSNRDRACVQFTLEHAFDSKIFFAAKREWPGISVSVAVGARYLCFCHSRRSESRGIKPVRTGIQSSQRVAVYADDLAIRCDDRGLFGTVFGDAFGEDLCKHLFLDLEENEALERLELDHGYAEIDACFFCGCVDPQSEKLVRATSFTAFWRFQRHAKRLPPIRYSPMHRW